MRILSPFAFLLLLCLEPCFPQHSGEAALGFDSGGLSGSLSYSYREAAKGAASGFLGYTDGDFSWRANASLPGSAFSLGLGTGYLGNSLSIRPRPFSSLLLTGKPAWPADAGMLAKSSHPSDLIIDFRAGDFRFFSAAALAGISASSVFGDLPATLQAKAETAGIEYAHSFLDSGLAGSFCLSHLPFRENSGGWQPESPAAMEGSLGSLSFAAGIGMASVEMGFWAGVSTGYFEPVGFAACSEVRWKGHWGRSGIEAKAGLCFFLASPAYRLIEGAWPSHDSVIKAEANLALREYSGGVSCSFYSPRGWLYTPSAPSPSLSGADLLLEYWKPTLLKCRLNLARKEFNATCDLSADKAGMARVTASMSFGMGPVCFLSGIKLRPRAEFSRPSLSPDEDNDDEEGDDDGDGFLGDPGGSVDDVVQVQGALATMELDRIACLIEFDWVFDARGPKAGRGKFSLSIARGELMTDTPCWAFNLGFSQAVPLTKDIGMSISLKSPSGGWRTNSAEQGSPSVSLGISMQGGAEDY
ncbi:MAG: hypothetical protein LLF89_07765 [Spirochaetaceae bacterium]|nr:hypothetical protein [Spirochaetaceae bacterium]